MAHSLSVSELILFTLIVMVTFNLLKELKYSNQLTMPSKKNVSSDRERKRDSKKKQHDDTGKYSQKHIRMLERFLEIKQQIKSSDYDDCLYN